MTDALNAEDMSVSSDCPAVPRQPCAQRIGLRETTLGSGLTIRRALPSRHRRMIGAWCFLDHIGPSPAADGEGLQVGPHPHIGLQTVTWLLEGEILHHDSLGYEQLIRPGQLNLMTSGDGIAHAETSPETRSDRLHGAQLWIALPEDRRAGAAGFEHCPELPVIERDGVRLTVLVGECHGERSPAAVHSPLVGIDVSATAAGIVSLGLRPAFEYGVLVLQGGARLTGEAVGAGTLLYLGQGRERLDIACEPDTRLLLLGGEPFGEEILLWWNFVARNKAEIAAADEDWRAGSPRFGAVAGDVGTPLTAPPLPWAGAD